MNTEIPWDKTRMEWRPVDMTVTYNGGTNFTAQAGSGDITFPMEVPVNMGGPGKVPNPIQYLIGSLGGCVGVKIVLALSDQGIVPDELTIGIHGTRKQTMPAFFDHIHLVIVLRADADEAMVSTIIEQTLARLCPIAAMFAEVGKVTSEHRIIRPSEP
jgi:putative redox protein